MIRFTGVTPEGHKVVGLGLTVDTIKEMLQGKKLVVDLDMHGIPDTQLLILIGRDDVRLAVDVQAQAAQAIGATVDPSAILQRPN